MIRPNTLRVSLALVCGLLWVAGCGPSSAPETGAPAPPERATLREGTPVRLTLLRRLESGRTPEGETFSLALAEDLKDAQGRVVVARGTPATGRVDWSRGGDVARLVANQPARLAITFDALSPAGGVPVPLRATAQPAENGRLEFNSENTQPPALSEDLASAVRGDPGAQEALRALALALAQDQPTQTLTAEQQRSLADLAGKLGMSETSAVLREEGADGKTLGGLARGDLSALAQVGGANALGGALMLAGAVESVGRSIDGWFKVRQVVAPVGLEVTAYVARDSEVRVGP